MRKAQLSLFIIVGIVVVITILLILGLLFSNANDIQQLTRGLEELPGLSTEIAHYTQSAFEEGTICGLVQHGLQKTDLNTKSLRSTQHFLQNYAVFEGLDVTSLSKPSVDHTIQEKDVSFTLHAPILVRDNKHFESTPLSTRETHPVRLGYLQSVEDTLTDDINLHYLEQLGMNVSVIGDQYTLIDTESSLATTPYWYVTS